MTATTQMRMNSNNSGNMRKHGKVKNMSIKTA
uniref:Uncharacterized protein n=1 Tax=Siphoviridae sp. ctLeh52 TaxID=2827849 RepID=A0A8S5RXG3_9CAUD|nr:MAG TPA: hypothetical protein [Siphoviridae sp. ctLeh52]